MLWFSGFLEKLVTNEDSAMQRAERGKLSLSQMIPELDAECVSAASDQKVSLPAGFSVKSLLEELRDSTTVNKHILQTVATLRRQGLLTGVLANQWVDDSGCGDSSGRLLSLLGGHFDVVLQSCRTGLRVPEADLFISALKQLGVPPKQVHPRTHTHNLTCHHFSLVRSKNPDVKLHYVEMGAGPPVMLCHGFPESWYSWRYQIPALADAGFRVVSLDMKGYGESTAPPDIEEYSQEQICQVKGGIPQVTLVGHDWGGSVVWNMAQCHPERVRAVASLNTPLFPVDPSKNPMDFLKTVPIFNYQLYFQEPGVAEAEMEKDLARTFKIFFHGGLFVGLPDEIPRSSILSETALQFYITQFKDKGFRGPLNWYRNVVSNWKWLCSRPRAKLLMPALMVTTGKDPVLLPVFSRGMENMIPNLTRGHIEECGHWTQMERWATICLRACFVLVPCVCVRVHSVNLLTICPC
uniref:Epoxide hydrolase 2, cytoplasmic n=1 Tax=Oncorhynchus kisutch TaxID=8019 RepID=A0A8C7CJ69_ONCKI